MNNWIFSNKYDISILNKKVILMFILAQILSFIAMAINMIAVQSLLGMI